MLVDTNITIKNLGDGSVNNWNDSFNHPYYPEPKTITEKLANSVVNGFVTIGGFAVGGSLACYALDGIATMLFPPAAAAAAFCPAVGAMSGGAKAFAAI
ncbi:hypothetical protein [Nostoc sp.]|uniref:hypothetical protein n=1 Tax=Nostoc sp. TaxID=1180 RepID=UPI002FF7BD3A